MKNQGREKLTNDVKVPVFKNNPILFIWSLNYISPPCSVHEYEVYLNIIYMCVKHN